MHFEGDADEGEGADAGRPASSNKETAGDMAGRQFAVGMAGLAADRAPASGKLGQESRSQTILFLGSKFVLAHYRFGERSRTTGDETAMRTICTSSVQMVHCWWRGVKLVFLC